MGRPMRPRRARRMPEATLRDAQRLADPADHRLVGHAPEHQLERPARARQHVGEHRRADRRALGRDAGVVEVAADQARLVDGPDDDRHARQACRGGRACSRPAPPSSGAPGWHRWRRRRAPACQRRAERAPSSTEGASTTPAIRTRRPGRQRPIAPGPFATARKPAGAVCSQSVHQGWTTAMRGSGRHARRQPLAVSPGGRSRPR